MKRLEINSIDFKYAESSYAEIALQLAHLPWHDLEFANWSSQYPSNSKVKFQIAYQETQLFIHYKVQEEFIRANYIRANENVWEDSCVEFFISLDNRKTYYNFEFNVLGTGLIGYGTPVKSERNRLTEDQIHQVDTYSEIKSIQGKKEWQLILAIPFSLFSLNKQDIIGSNVHANFYKCGDKLPNPHFLSWSEVLSESPNFHLPEHFGELHFK